MPSDLCVIDALLCCQDSGAVASLLVEYDSGLLPHLPFPLHSADRCLLFALQPRSKSHRAFYSKVKPEASLWLSEVVPSSRPPLANATQH